MPTVRTQAVDALVTLRALIADAHPAGLDATRYRIAVRSCAEIAAHLGLEPTDLDKRAALYAGSPAPADLAKS